MIKMTFDQFNKLVIYGNGEVLFAKERDLSNYATLKDGKPAGNLDRIISFNLMQEPKNARKENLNRTDNYYLTYHPEYWRSERRTALYVHISEIDAVNLGEIVHMQHNGETDYIEAFKLIFKHGGEIKKVNVDRLSVPEGWTIPEEEQKNGAHWKRGLGDFNNSYDTPSSERKSFFQKKHPDQPDYNLIHWYITTEPLTENYYTGDYISRIKKDADREQRDRIAEIMTECTHGSISHYDVEKMLEKLNITIRTDAARA